MSTIQCSRPYQGYQPVRSQGNNYYSDPFQNANQGLYDNPNYNGGAVGQIQMSSRAQMIMSLLSMMNSLMSGAFGQMMNQGQEQAFPVTHPGFGRQDVGGPPSAGGLSQVKPGETRELKAGEAVRGPNGSVVNWHNDGRVTANYTDKNGRQHKVEIQGDHMIVDGGEPQKLDKLGQIVKLPNGDVIARGRAEQPGGGRVTSRAAVSGSVDGIGVNPPGRTSVHQVDAHRSTETRNEGAYLSVNYSEADQCSPYGHARSMNFSMSAFLGVPVSREVEQWIAQVVGVK